MIEWSCTLTEDSIPIEDKNRCPIRVDFLPIECILSLDIFLVNVFSSSVLYLSTISFRRLDSLMKAATSAMILTASIKSSRSSLSDSVHCNEWETKL